MISMAIKAAILDQFPDARDFDSDGAETICKVGHRWNYLTVKEEGDRYTVASRCDLKQGEDLPELLQTLKFPGN